MEKITKSNKIKRSKKHGYMSRNASHSGRKVLKARRIKMRKNITI